MSSKRRALGQLTKDGIGGDDSDSDNNTRSTASAAILSQRKLAVPRGKSGAQAGAFANPFAALKPQPEGANPVSNPFASFSKQAPQNNTTLRLRALNEKFADTIANLIRDSPNTSWVQTCESYIRYHGNIVKEQTPEPNKMPTQSSEPVAKKEPVPAKSEGDSSVVMKDDNSSSSSDSEEEEDERQGLKATADNPFKNGFKFGGSSSSSDKFAFGGKVVDVSSNHSKSKSTGGFVFEGGKGKINFADTGNDPAFSANSGSTKSDDDKKESGAGNKTVGSKALGDSAAESRPLFTFGKKEDNSQDKEEGESSEGNNQKPMFSFGSASGKEPQDKPTFSFEKPEQPSKSENAPAFSFGKPDPKQSSESQVKPVFSFGSGENKPSLEKPTFSFGSNTEKDKPAFSFGASTEKDKPAFSFGANTEKDKPAFSFGSNTEKDKPAFSFESSTEKDKPAFSFSSNSGTDKPAFSFGSGSFKFGQPGGNSSFTFGKTPNPFGQSSETSWKPGQKVEIQQPEEEQPAEPEGGEEDQSNLDGPGPGEEDEDAIFEHRSKAYVSEDKQYKSLGVGQLRILKNRKTGFARALLRSEGGGRPLLNIPLKEGLEYPVTGKTNVQIMDPVAENGPKAYLVRVKTEDDAKLLKEKIDEVKN